MQPSICFEWVKVPLPDVYCREAGGHNYASSHGPPQLHYSISAKTSQPSPASGPWIGALAGSRDQTPLRGSVLDLVLDQVLDRVLDLVPALDRDRWLNGT